MATSIRLDDTFIEDVRISAQAQSRSVPKQIEHWGRIGKLMEDNPDLTYAFLREVLEARAEMEAGKVSKYVRRSKRN